MNAHQAPNETLPKHLGNGLALRSSIPEDVDRLVEFFVRVFGEDEGDIAENIGIWVRDLLTLENNGPDRRTGFLVEDESSGRIASALVSIPQTWTYAGIPILVGRPESVATDKEFRNKGLVRALFDEFHRSSQARGDLLQGITGIPWFYRQFGYEMTVEFGGSRCAYETQVKAAAQVEKAGRSVRPAARDDIPFLHDLYQASGSRYLLHCPLSPDWWLTELERKHPDNLEKTGVFILEAADKQPAGFFIISRELDEKAVFLRYVEIQSGIDWCDYMPLVIEQVWSFGQELAAKAGSQCSRLAFGLGSQHPAYQAAAPYLPEYRRPYNWFLRVPDLPKLIQRIAPVLEKNISNSPFSGYSGNLKISFYKSDLHIEFQSGALIKAERAPASVWHAADVCFPDLTFLQLLFGYRSSRELSDFFADCRVSEKFIPLLDALFPKQNSLIFPIE